MNSFFWFFRYDDDVPEDDDALFDMMMREAQVFLLFLLYNISSAYQIAKLTAKL